MKFIETPLKGAYVVEMEPFSDDRGFFGRAFCAKEFAEAGLAKDLVTVYDSWNKKAGTMRGIHYQLPPDAETKMVRCSRGAVYDVILDLRKDSPTFLRSFGAELTQENRRMLYVPKQFGHAFITLEDNTEVLYFVDEFYSPRYERGLRWNDPKFGIEWPCEPTVISEKDGAAKDFDPDFHLSS